MKIMDNLSSTNSNENMDFVSFDLNQASINIKREDTYSNDDNQNYFFREELENINPIVKHHKWNEPVSVFDVARYILGRLEDKRCSTMKLHKLLYYCQAWAMVWEEQPLFKERIEAWANGPVIRELFLFHRGMYNISYWDISNGNENLLGDKQKEVIDEVLNFYGNKDAQWLIDLTHSETPWQDARKGLKQLERGNNEITLDSMAEYYSSL